ncbi:MAG: ABC transporter ATP-binding protein [Betaproteobacteria bacterium]|nr:ABC transporter ATP-binding protein [Betaproteobacteria bacterium]
MNADAVLSIEKLDAGYGSAQVLFGVDIDVRRSEVVALMGRNGMGKTTLVKSIVGLAARMAGRILVGGEDVTRWASYRVARKGVGLVPEGRHVFSALTTEENLVATAREPAGGNAWSLDGVFELFPRLAERRRHYGNQLSGGEQQMLAIGRALLTQPTLLILDEATEGLAPLIRQEIWRTLQVLKSRGLSVLVVDRNLRALGALADRYVVLEKGRVARTGPASDLLDQRALIERYIGV